MILWITSNLGTIIVTLVLIAIVTLIILNMRKESRKGKSVCCGHCSHCPMSGTCHQK